MLKWLRRRKFRRECARFGVCPIHLVSMAEHNGYGGYSYHCQTCQRENEGKRILGEESWQTSRRIAADRLRKVAEREKF